jgi:hypothetical protein
MILSDLFRLCLICFDFIWFISILLDSNLFRIYLNTLRHGVRVLSLRERMKYPSLRTHAHSQFHPCGGLRSLR